MDQSSVPFLSRTSDEESLDEKSSRSLVDAKRQRTRPIAIKVLCCVTIFLAIWGVYSLCLQIISFTLDSEYASAYDVYRPDNLPTGWNECDCGTTINEGLSKSCVYDALATAWLPPHCRD